MGMHYSEYGDKHAKAMMVFLHGGGVSGWMWDKQIRHFTDYHCIVPDLPEQGLSHNGAAFSIRGSAAQLIALIEEKACGREVIVIGFSLGAQVAIQLLSMKPGLVQYAVINSALVRPMRFASKLVRPSVRLTMPLTRNRTFARLQARTLYVDHEYFDKYYQESSQMKAETLIRILEENMSFDIPPQFKNAGGKILVTVGEKEKAAMIKSAKAITASNANCTGVIIPQIGHGISLANPDYFNRMVEGWIQRGGLPDGCKIIG